MKKLILLSAMAIFFGMAGSAQSFEKGNHAINLGFGLGNTRYFGAYYKGFTPSVSASYEMGIVEVPMGTQLTGVVGVGGYLGWSTSRYEYNWSNYYYRYNNFMIAVRGNYHFIFHEKLDPYFGIWAGVNVFTGGWRGDPPYPSSSVYKPSRTGATGGAYVGARYYFTDNLAVYAELGYLISVLNLGITFKIQ